MADLAEVLKRITRDSRFVERLIADPKGALARYRLSADDLDIVAAAVTAKREALGAARPEARRSALVDLLTRVVAPEGAGDEEETPGR